MKFWKACATVVAIGAVVIGGFKQATTPKVKVSPGQVVSTQSGDPQNGGNTNGGGGPSGPVGQGFFAPYIDVTLRSVPSLETISKGSGQKRFTLAFITGGACNPNWAGAPLNQVNDYYPHLLSDINYLQSNGGEVIIAFGGAGGTDIAAGCSDVASLQAQYQAVIDTYHVHALDFDIESGASDTAANDRRSEALVALQKANPGLRILLTVPVLTTGLTEQYMPLIKNVAEHGVKFVVNGMAMDYGGANSQMGQAAISVANSLFSQLKDIYPSITDESVLWSMVGVTPMIGENDTEGEVFTQDNARELLAFAQEKKIGLLAMWSTSRDFAQCPPDIYGSGPPPRVNPYCNNVSKSDYEYMKILQAF